ncbi:hypothetical protein [Rhizobium leucaenae]|uniref:Fe-S-cluster containining protein n=1 Tax=Rhizobium leucaenae TaxID=29450 RepID=A0A7W6ZYN6_9HYPH|nr:hypothetical protein [Rhizobium leucaenae]MBB4570595.1 Fe-S-cluster containining protein [Rhizobium leucaenae]
MTQIVVNKLQANIYDHRPDIFPLFAETVEKINETACEVSREIHCATVDAILDAAVDVVPRDAENVLHRLGCARYLLDVVYDRAFKGLEIEDVIQKIDTLLTGAARGFAEACDVDMRSTRLDFYFPRQQS